MKIGTRLECNYLKMKGKNLGLRKKTIATMGDHV